MREWAPHLMEHFVTQPQALQVTGGPVGFRVQGLGFR
jgi:hypothetical protein